MRASYGQRGPKLIPLIIYEEVQLTFLGLSGVLGQVY